MRRKRCLAATSPRNDSNSPVTSESSESSASPWPSSTATWIDLDLAGFADYGSAMATYTILESSQTSQEHFPTREEQQTIPETRSQPDPYHPFFVPDSILFKTPAPLESESKFLQLPSELLRLIFQYVGIPHFQVSLALTCKILSRVASQNNVMAPWRGYRDKDGLFRLLERQKYKPYIPDTFRACRACFQFRPRDITYWEKELRNPEFDNLKANWFDLLSWFEPRDQQHRCPWCTIREYSAYFQERMYIKDRDTEANMRSYPMCPSVVKRIERP